MPSASMLADYRPERPLRPLWAQPTTICMQRLASIPGSPAAQPLICPPHLLRCGKVEDWVKVSYQAAGRPCRPSFSTATGTPQCIQTMAPKFLNRPSVRRERKKRCTVGRYLEAMPIPARSISMWAGAKFWSTGLSTAPATRGRAVAPPAPILIRKDRTQRGKCCVSSSGIPFTAARGVGFRLAHPVETGQNPTDLAAFGRRRSLAYPLLIQNPRQKPAGQIGFEPNLRPARPRPDNGAGRPALIDLGAATRRGR